MKLSTRKKLLEDAEKDIQLIRRSIVEQRLTEDINVFHNLMSTAFVKSIVGVITKYKNITKLPTGFWSDASYLLGDDILKSGKLDIDKESANKLRIIISDIISDFTKDPEFNRLIKKLNDIQSEMMIQREFDPNRKRGYDRKMWISSLNKFYSIIDDELIPIINSILTRDKYKNYKVLVLAAFKNLSADDLKKIETNYFNIIKKRALDYVKTKPTYKITGGEEMFMPKSDFPPGKMYPLPNKYWDE